MGPALPPEFKKQVQDESEGDVDSGVSGDPIGPPLPGSHSDQQRSEEDPTGTRIGPQLPTKAASTFCERDKDRHELATSGDSGPKAEGSRSGREYAYGPTLPPDIASESEAHMYGPSLPPDLEVPQEVPPVPGGEPSDGTDDVIGPGLPSAVESEPSGGMC